MKRKNLPLILVLITIVLGVISLGFVNFKSGAYASYFNGDEGTVVSSIKTSSDYLAMIRTNQASGVITPEDYNKVQKQLQVFNSERATSELKWSQLGPDNFGGSTRAVIFDNKTANATVLYAGGVTGGLWKSVNSGITWLKVNESTYNLNVSCMAQDAEGSIYVGTGELFNSQLYSALDEMGYTSGFMGQGIFKSTDGENFQLLPSTAPTYNYIESDWAFINELGINPETNGVFAATNTGLKYSADKGQTWVTVKDTAGTELVENAYDVQVSSSGSVIAAIGNKCYVSLDGSIDAFMFKSTGDSVSLPVANDVRRIEFAYAPSDPNIVYASVVNKFGSNYGIYVSVDKGDTWRVILPSSNAIVIFNGMGIYDNIIKVFPNNAGKVLLGGVDLWEGTKVQETGFYSWVKVSESFSNSFNPSYLHSSQHAIAFRPGTNNSFFVANDGGVYIGSVSSNEYSFETSNRNYFTTQFYNVAPSGHENYVLGGVQGNGSILITGQGNTTKQGEMVLGGDGGACALSLINKDVMVVSSVNGTFFRSEDAGVTYSNQFIDGISLSTTSFNTPLALWESFDNSSSRDSLMYFARDTITGGTRIQVLSNNSRQPFYYTTPNDVNLYPGDSIKVCDVVSSRLFIASNNIVGMTKELHLFAKDPEWFVIANATVSNFIGEPQCLAYSSDANHLFVGMRDGRIYRISNLALAYNYARADVNSSECIVATQEIPLYIPGTSTPITQVVTSISVDQSNPNNIMVTLGNYGNETYVLYSENALDQVPVFTSKQGNLPQMPVYTSILEMTNTDMAIIGTEHGIFVNENIHSTSAQWMKQDSLMGSVPVFQLQQQTVSKVRDTVYLINGSDSTMVVYPGTNNYGIIYSATYGRGLFRSNTYRKPVGIEEHDINTISQIRSLKLYPNPVSTQATIELAVEQSADIMLTIYDIAGRKVGQQLVSVQKGDNKILLKTDNLKSGAYVITATAGSARYSQKFIVK
jgi:hypothetical protein